MPVVNRVCSIALLSLGFIVDAQAAPFLPCPDADTDAALQGSQCAVERAPAERAPADAGAADATGPTGAIDLFVRKFPASGASRGNVWLVAGGPGESGAAFYGLLPRLRETFPGFDLIVPDHRGTGFSTRMCPREEAPASPGGTALAGNEWTTCLAQLNAEPARTRQFTLTNAAYDLQLLLARTPRQGKTFVYGVSYGTQLVLRTLALGAPGVDGVMLDSLVPLQDDATADLSRRSLVTDAAGRRVLAQCDASPMCSRKLGAPAETVYRRVLARAASEPQLLADVPGKNLKRFLGSLLDVPGAGSQIPYLIKALDEGNTAPLQAVVAQVQQVEAALGTFPQSPPSIPLVSLISGSENDLRPGRTAQEVRQEEDALLFSSPLPGMLARAPLAPYPRDAWFGRTPARLPPTLVLQGELDGKTPYDAALRHIDVLRRAGPVQLYKGERSGHFVLWSNPACAQWTMRQFVLGAAQQQRCVSVSSHD